MAHLPVGQALVRIGSKLPRHLVLPFIGNRSVLPARVRRVAQLLLLKTPYVSASEEIDAAYERHRQTLLPAPPDADDDVDEGDAAQWK